MLSKRFSRLNMSHTLADAHFRCAENPYSEANTEGYINLGTAQHGLCCQDAQKILEGAPAAELQDYQYQCLHGKAEARKVVAQWLSARAERPLNPDNLVLASGATALIEAVGFALCDPGDVILIPSPSYSGFDYDLRLRAQVEVEYLPGRAEQQFKIQPDLLDQHLESSVSEGRKIRALLLHNPANPSGLYLTSDQLEAILAVCEKWEIDLVVDEVCADTVFAGNGFVSALRYSSPKVHTLYSLGKGFSISGLPTGFFYSEDPELVKAVADQAYFFRMSNAMQTQIAWLLGSSEAGRFLENSCRRLASVSCHLIDRLEKMGVTVLRPEAGVFIWMDLGEVLGIEDHLSELKVFEALMSDARLNISPGQFFHCISPGWFRLCYSVSPAMLDCALGRLSDFIESCDGKSGE
ncbi:aminotransferase class I/II-fold pyridoxal phosphate-dependent enzyme [Endozoicomonas arenosclerae]|uniref:aminotransferase class I/II-fold pyridoxal phosphate-dependent enzyme n=1 Tax=Endozoicomonas arenosclerae TaxID=1633495 RepID=UPI0007832201|nr:aminotransferase class I/II-fold pyridoxal phosphate-dependent enzyme [Endozoicomonas arenosclerae]